MAKMTNDTTNNLWVLEQTATGAGTFTDLLTTENKFLDKNISIKSIIPSAQGPVLSITDKGSVDIGIGTVNQGYYPLSTALTGTLTVGTPGWITTTGLSAQDESVIVGRIKQSTLANGNTAINSGATITPSVSSNQTINISAGYNAARTIVVAPMSSGTPAEASVTISGTATTPTLANTASSINGKTQVNVTDITTSSSAIDSTYYVALTAEAPATTPTVGKNVSTAGYLGEANQISHSGSIGKKSQLYFAELTSGKITIGGNSDTVGNPTLAKYNTDGDGGGANINGTDFIGTPVLTEPTSGNYVAVSVTIPSISIKPTVSLTTAGWIGAASQVTANNVTSSGKTVQVYVPIKSGTLAKGTGAVEAESGNITLGTKTTTQPTSGKYIKVTGSGTVSVGTSGYLASGASQTSNDSIAYYPLYNMTINDFTVTANVIKSNKAGWIDNNVTVATIEAGTISTGTTAKTGWETNTTAVVPEQGYLYIGAGYYPNTQISLATLIPDNTDYPNVTVTDQILAGYEAYDTDGKRLVGTLATYDGTYSVTGWTVA